jgi:EamA domain-containing membrane protein RarD
MFGEPFTFLRGVSFVLIWMGLGFFSWDTLRRARNA